MFHIWQRKCKISTKYWRATSSLGHQTQQHQPLMWRQHWRYSKNKKERWGMVWNLLPKILLIRRIADL